MRLLKEETFFVTLPKYILLLLFQEKILIIVTHLLQMKILNFWNQESIIQLLS